MSHSDNDHEGRDDTPFEGRTYLYIRDHPADDGSEPLPPSLEFWISPDITVIKPDGTRGSEAVAGQPNQVEVFVNNAGGIEAVDAYVDVFHANPSTAFNPMTADLIGGGPLTIPGYNRRQITFPWVPPVAAAGHRCLLARVSLLIPPDTYLNGLIFDVPGDRHVSQRNLHVVALGDSDEMEFMFDIVNPGLEPATFTLGAVELRSRRELEALRGTLACGSLRLGEKPLESIVLRSGRRRFTAPVMNLDNVRRLDRFNQPGRGIGGRSRDKGLVAEVEAGSAQQASLVVQRNPATRQGDMHAIRITQVDEQGMVRGGLTVLVQH